MNEKENKTRPSEPLRGFPIEFCVYARSEQEVADLRLAIVAFISAHAREGRAVDAARLARAISSWDSNPIVKNRIIQYFQD